MPTFVTNDGVSLSYRDSGGAGRALVMVHGWSQTQSMFRFQLQGLASGRRVITYDQRGHGESEKPNHGYRIARLAQDLRELVEHLQLTEIDLLGWSMGACVSWSYVDQFGSAPIRRLIIVDQPAALAAVPWMTTAEQVESGATMTMSAFVELAEELSGPRGEAVLQSFERTMLSGDTDPELWEFISHEIRSVPMHAAVPLLFSHATQDWRDVLPRIDVPTLVLGCEGSHVSVESQRYLARSIPGSRLYIFGPDEANSHFPFLENPTAFNRVVNGFLAEA
jgi:pimeloyl-ACP methyl ester carboxylesterase